MKKVIVGIITLAVIVSLVWTFNKGKVEVVQEIFSKVKVEVVEEVVQEIFNKGKVEAVEIEAIESEVESESEVEAELVQESVNNEDYEIEQAKIQGEEVLKIFDNLTTEKPYIKDIIYTTDLKQILIKVDGNEYRHEETSTIQLMIGILVSGINMKDYSCKVVIQDINTNEIISKEIY